MTSVNRWSSVLRRSATAWSGVATASCSVTVSNWEMCSREWRWPGDDLRRPPRGHGDLVWYQTVAWAGLFASSTTIGPRAAVGHWPAQFSGLALTGGRGGDAGPVL